MYPSHKFNSGVTPCEHDVEELYQWDFEKKMLMKGYRRQQVKEYVKTSDIQVGDCAILKKDNQ